MNITQRITRPNARIAYADTGGDGPAVVLTHGAGVDHTMFDVQSASLTGHGFRVIVWDMRGHGQSTLEREARFAAGDALGDLQAILDACQVQKAVLVGHSLGGNLTQAFARDQPERVSGLIVMDSTWNTGPLSALERFALRLATPSLGLIPAAALPRVMARASAVSPTAIAKTEAVFARMPKRRFLEVWKATVSLVNPDPAYRFTVPLALVRGAEDRTGNIATAMPRWALTEGIHEHVIPQAGHMVTWDAPEDATRTMLAILEGWNMAPRRRGAAS